MGYLTLNSGGGSNDEGLWGPFVFNTAAAGSPGTDPSDPLLNARQHAWLPYDTTLQNFAWLLTAAPGSGKTMNLRVHQDDNGIITPIYQIIGASSVDVSADIEADIPALDPTSDTTIRNRIHYGTVWPSTVGNAAGASFRAFEYLTITHPELCYFVLNIGGDIATATIGGTDNFAPITGGAISSANTTNVFQVPMSAKGRIKVAWAAWRGFTNTSTLEAFIQKGALGAAADTSVGFTMVGAGTTTPYQASIITPNVAVAEGDYLNWRLKRTAGAATTAALQLGFGYAAGLP